MTLDCHCSNKSVCGDNVGVSEAAAAAASVPTKRSD